MTCYAIDFAGLTVRAFAICNLANSVATEGEDTVVIDFDGLSIGYVENGSLVAMSQCFEGQLCLVC